MHKSVCGKHKVRCQDIVDGIYYHGTGLLPLHVSSFRKKHRNRSIQQPFFR